MERWRVDERMRKSEGNFGLDNEVLSNVLYLLIHVNFLRLDVQVSGRKASGEKKQRFYGRRRKARKFLVILRGKSYY